VILHEQLLSCGNSIALTVLPTPREVSDVIGHRTLNHDPLTSTVIR
jgi:hypothetical protein